MSQRSVVFGSISMLGLLSHTRMLSRLTVRLKNGLPPSSCQCRLLSPAAAASTPIGPSEVRLVLPSGVVEQIIYAP